MMKGFLSIVLLLPLFLPAPLRGGEVELVVITSHASAEKLTEKSLMRIYLKRKVLWEDGSRIVAVNLPGTNELRKLFSDKIIGMGHRQLVDYWNEQHFKGVRPPVVLESEDAVKSFVREVDGAVGYISAANMESSFEILYRVGAGR